MMDASVNHGFHQAPRRGSCDRGEWVTASDGRLTSDDILSWLTESYEPSLELLWALADIVRQSYVGNSIHIRALAEISNLGHRRCAFCGTSPRDISATAYRMTEDEIMEAAGLAVKSHFGTVVLQAGEDPGLTTEFMAGAVRRIKTETPLAVTLCLGERSDEDLSALREAGADRYFLCFETFDPELFARVHPSASPETLDPLGALKRTKELGYETGCSLAVGISGQTYQSLARDIEILRELDLDMIVVGPAISFPTEQPGAAHAMSEDLQVPSTETMAYKVLALARLVCPEANVFSTTTSKTADRIFGRFLGLARGANVLVHDVTPPRFRPHTADAGCSHDPTRECVQCLRARIHNMGRSPAFGPGGRG
jgi:biotin synthase